MVPEAGSNEGAIRHLTRRAVDGRPCNVLLITMQSSVSFNAEVARSLGGPEWLCERRLVALERFAESPPPAVDEDLWRYSSISDLDLDSYGQSGQSPEPSRTPT